jgi:protein phosphatase
MALQIDLAARTHRGHLRESNQDAVLILEAPETPVGVQAVAAVADGMGGLPAGDVASRLAIESLRSSLASLGRMRDHEQFLREAIGQANRAVYEDARDTAEHRGMGTTLTLAVASEGRLTVGHVGDSRAYLLRSGELRQLSVDHTWVQAGLDAGILTPAEAAVHPYRNMLTRALGLEPSVEIQVIDELLIAGDAVLVCSDGLHGEVSDAGLRDVLGIGTAAESAQALEEAALALGGSDNVTIAVIKVLAEAVHD